MKRTHKFKELKDIELVVAKASSLGAAAKALGVDRSTLHRWLGAGKVKRPRSQPPLKGPVVAPVDPTSWADQITTAYALSTTDRELVGLAAAALAIAKTSETERDRLAGMARFQQLVRQLNLDMQEKTTATPKLPDRVLRRVSGDPRDVLRAVK